VQCSLDALRRKEVIDVHTGEKLGFIDDLELDTDHCSLRGFVIYGRRRLFGLFGRDADIFIPCEGVRLYGKDVLLAEPFYREPSDCTKIAASDIKNFVMRR